MDNIDFLTTKSPITGLDMYKAASELAKIIQKGKICRSYEGWFIQANFEKNNPEFSYKRVPNTNLISIHYI